MFGTLLAQNSFTKCDTSSGTLKLGDCLKLSGTQSVGDVYSSPVVLVNLLVRNAFIIGGIIIFVMIIIAGYQYITQDSKGADNAKSILTAAIGGFLLMFAAYWILQIIKVVTGADVGI